MNKKLAGMDPEAVRLASIMVRYALSDPRCDNMSGEERRAAVELFVGRIMAKGAFVRDGQLFMPPEGQRQLLED